MMVTAEAREVFARTGRKVVVGPRAEWSEVFEGNPHISRKIGEETLILDNYKGHRPYIGSTFGNRIHFTDYKARPGELYLKFRERKWAERAGAGFVLIEPNTKKTVFADNKEWGHQRYQAVVTALPYRFVQIGPKKTLKGVDFVETPTFRLACAVLERAALYLGGEGGLHHAAAALKRPAVVIFGGHSDPNVTGYDGHVNIARGEACGSFRSCDHCRQAMNSITVDEVAQAVRDVYEKSR